MEKSGGLKNTELRRWVGDEYGEERKIEGKDRKNGKERLFSRYTISTGIIIIIF